MNLQGGHPLEHGHIKCNFDVMVFPLDPTVGYGFILRDEAGNMIKAKNGRRHGNNDAFEAEALSCREDLSWLKMMAV